ncbi:MAG: hypothetical protein R2822_23430 [Spirosomataceae bacterium]
MLISHKLDELFRIADRYIVLRDGKTIESGEMKQMTHDQLIQKMVGREILIHPKAHTSSASHELLSVQQLSLKHRNNQLGFVFSNISFFSMKVRYWVFLA